jgi:hypothetical protein
VKLTSRPLLSAQSSFSRPSKPSKSLFTAPLFSYSYKLLLPQPLSFHNDPNCPGVTLCGLRAPNSVPSVLSFFPSFARVVFLASCSLFGALASLSRSPFLCFQQLADSSRKMPAWGGTSAFIPLYLPSHVPRSASIPSVLNQLRILPVATGMEPFACRPSRGSRLQRPALKPRTSSYLQPLFPKCRGGASRMSLRDTWCGGASVALDTYTRGWILGKQSRSTQP